MNALAAAYSIAALVTFLVAWPVLRRRYGWLDSRRTLSVLARLMLAAAVSAAMVAACRVLVFSPYEVGEGKLLALLHLSVTSVLVLAVFAVAAWALRVPEMRELLSWVTRAARRLR